MYRTTSKSRNLKFVLIALIVLGSISFTKLSTISAQSGSTGSKVCECIAKGIALLEKYKIPGTALNELVPLLNDQAALMNRLKQFGLTDDQISTLLTEAAPLIKSVTEGGGNVSNPPPTLLDSANALLDKYKIPHEALGQLLPLIGDQELLVAQLGKFGLNPEQIQSMLTEAAPLIEQGMSTGAINDYLVENAKEVLAKYNIPEGKLDEFLALKGDPKAIADFMKQEGVSEDGAKAFQKDIQPLEGLGLDSQALDYQLGEQATALLGKYNLPPTALKELIPLVKDPQALAEKLGSMGLDKDAIQNLLKDAAPLIEQGLSSGAIDRFVAQQTVDLMDKFGIPHDKAEEFIAASKDPAALESLLKEYGASGDDLESAKKEMSTNSEIGTDNKNVETITKEEDKTDQNITEAVKSEDQSSEATGSN